MDSKKDKGRILTGLITILLALVIVFCLYKIYTIAQDYLAGQKEYRRINTLVSADSTESQDKETADSVEKDSKTAEVTGEMEETFTWYQVDWQSLDSETAENTAGWIVFENEDICYPVMYSGDNDTFLHAAPDGSYLYAGSIFMEGLNDPAFTDGHTILYGHNMKDKSMFGKLKYYQKDGYYEEHAYFQILTPEKSMRFRIFAYADVAEDSDIYTVPYNDPDDLKSFISELLSQSWITPDADTEEYLDGNHPVITLSTCSTEGRRFTVHAVCVEEK